MECPYCKKETSLGYIHNGSQPVQWMKEGSKPSAFRFSAAENGVELQGSMSILGYEAEAHYCRGCGIVIAKTS